MINLEYIPLNKYDEVIEHFDGTVTIPRHNKKRYLFVSDVDNDKVFFLNNLTGCIYSYDLKSKELLQVNSRHTEIFKNNIGIAKYKNFLLTYNQQNKAFIFYNVYNQIVEQQIYFDENINSFFIYDSYLWYFNRKDATLTKCLFSTNGINILDKYFIKGIGESSIFVANDGIYITDSEENLIRKYSFDGNLLFEAITPFIDPIGQFIYNNEHYVLYGGLVNEVGYENRCWQEQKPFFHKIKISVVEDDIYTTTYTNSFEVEFFYEENIYENVLNEILPATFYLSLPENTEHQKVISITPLGMNFQIEEINNKKYAKFVLNEYDCEIQQIGYKALLHLRSVKKIVKNKHTLKLSSNDLLSDVEKKELGIDENFFKQFIINEPIDDVDKILRLRNEIFKRLTYKKNIYAKNFKEVLQDGYGTCGDYTSLMLIFFNLNNISCNSASGYKIPRFYNATSGIISIYFNHSWVEVYDCQQNILPMESSSDDKDYNNRFSEGQFLGIDWTHIKLYNSKANPNLIKVVSNKEVHPFDIFKKASVFVIVKREIL